MAAANTKSIPGISGPTYQFILAVLRSERTKYAFNLIPYISDFEVFEHLDKPYLTGRLIISDSQAIFSTFDIIGGETIDIEIKGADEVSPSIKKTFYISEVDFTRKVNDESELLGLELIEDFAYKSNLISISKSYNDTPYGMINSIANEYLSTPVYTRQEDNVTRDYQKRFKVIIPNLNPLEALSWIKNKTTDKDGMPFYLFSSFTDNIYPLHFEDLATLLKEPAMNTTPYSIWNGAKQQPNAKEKTAQVLDSRYTETNSLFKLIRRGAVGAKYSYINTLNGTSYDFNLNATRHVLRNYVKNVLDKPELEDYKGSLPYDNRFKFNDKPFDEYNSRTISKIVASGAYSSGSGSSISYDEEEKNTDYHKKAIARSTNLFLTNSPLSIVINGNGFIDGNINTTIGRKIKIQSMKSGSKGGNIPKIDPKRSGDFMIFAARHMFKAEGTYHLALTCVKIGNDEV